VGSIELELKGVVPDPDPFRAALLAAGATPGERGMLHDRRYDRALELTARDELIRTRTFIPATGGPRVQLGWKGPALTSPEGYKRREERELDLAAGDPGPFLHALGYTVIHAIDRYIETYHLGEGHARMEWYPRMDVLVEVEGTPAAIERIIGVSGVPRAAFTSEALTAFTARYDAAHPDRPSLVSQDSWQGPTL
jgi:adenylate cyclase class IV